MKDTKLTIWDHLESFQPDKTVAVTIYIVFLLYTDGSGNVCGENVVSMPSNEKGQDKHLGLQIDVRRCSLFRGSFYIQLLRKQNESN